MLAILDQDGPERHERERERVHLTILALSHGELDELRKLVAHAKRDYRDVLYWAELAQGHHNPFADRFTEALLTPEAAPTRLALLKAAVPEATRIAVLWNPGGASQEAQMAELEATARGLAATLQPIHDVEARGVCRSAPWRALPELRRWPDWEDHMVFATTALALIAGRRLENPDGLRRRLGRLKEDLLRYRADVEEIERGLP